MGPWKKKTAAKSNFTLTDFLKQIPFVLQEGPVVATLGNGLRAPEIDVDGIAVVLGEQARLEQHLRVVATELKMRRKGEKVLWEICS